MRTSSSSVGQTPRAIRARLLDGVDHYDELVQKAIASAKVSLWIATATVKEMRLEAPIGTVARAKGRFVSILDTLAAPLWSAHSYYRNIRLRVEIAAGTITLSLPPLRASSSTSYAPPVRRPGRSRRASCRTATPTWTSVSGRFKCTSRSFVESFETGPGCASIPGRIAFRPL
jgi:hypothetical protein